MKTKVTKKEILNNYEKVICVGYCSLQNLLSYKNAKYYTSGQYGWNADIYIDGKTAIVTGYRLFGNIKARYDIFKKYDDKARTIIETRDYRVIDSQLDLLLFKFIQEVTR